MQKFFTDKPKLFECNISVDGANLNETKARLVLELPNNRNLLFHGNVDANGKCEVLIPALKELNECEGDVLLEVIAESTYFESWKDKFKLEATKKVHVEVFTPEKEVIVENKTTPQVEVITESVEETNKNKIWGGFKQYINENRININRVIKNETAFYNLLHDYKKNKKATKDDIIIIVEELKKVAKSNQIKDLLKS